LESLTKGHDCFLQKTRSRLGLADIWSGYAMAEYGPKPWEYLLVPHDVIADNMTLKGLADVSRILDA
jgi:hypothetical protein